MAAVRIGLTAVVFAACGASAHAQATVGVEYDRDRFTYHFTNPSSFDTSTLVPHFFEQRYDADNVWLIASARYGPGGARWETDGGITPSRASTADDYDTFFDPDGSTIVSGTTGPTAIQSWRVGQRGDVWRASRTSISLGYRLRVDRSNFGVGHKTVVRNGVLVQAFDVGTPERTTSQMHEIFAAVRFEHGVGGGWLASLDARGSPMTLARLTVDLPDKYPGQDLTFNATVAAATARLTMSRPSDRWPVTIGVDVGGTWSYSSDAALRRRTAALSVTVRP